MALTENGGRPLIRLVLNHIGQEFVDAGDGGSGRKRWKDWSRDWPGPWRPWSRDSSLNAGAITDKKRWRYRREENSYLVYDRATGRVYKTDLKGLRALLEGKVEG